MNRAQQVEHYMIQYHTVSEDTANEIVMEELPYIQKRLEEGVDPKHLAQELTNEYNVGEDGSPEVNTQEMQNTHPISGNRKFRR